MDNEYTVMNKIYKLLCFIFLINVVSPLVANEQYCAKIEASISKLDQHADNYYSLANYRINDPQLLSDLQMLSQRLNDSLLSNVLTDVESAIKNNDKELMMRVAPLSRYLNEWDLVHCS